MKYSLTAAALLAATASADLCSLGSTDDNGNYYCQEVQAITYTGVGGSNSYNQITNMDSASGACSSTPFGYSGTLAPLNEEVSMHFRGPLNLKKFAFYAPSADATAAYKRAAPRKSAHDRRHGHGHNHAHLHKRHGHEERGLGDPVTATINGIVETWANDWSGVATSAPAVASQVASAAASAASAIASEASGSSGNSGASVGASTGTGWTRQGYYNADDGTSDGLVFLNHNGGSGSGVFDYTFGNSLSYASADGQSGSASPQVLADTTLPSDTEVVIMTDKQCTGDSCGYYRDGTVAYHGFDGADKAFFFEFEMPNDGQTAASIYDPVNMPAIWLLNAQIPRTLQYGQADCSCWTTGCGEFDIFEVLAPGDDRCKSTLHGNIQGGDSDYFARPTNGTIQATLLMYNNNLHIKILNQPFDFGSTMGSTWVTQMCEDTLEQSLSTLTSLFQLSG